MHKKPFSCNAFCHFPITPLATLNFVLQWNFSCTWANCWEGFVSKDLVYFAGKWPPQNCFYGISESLEACLYGCTCWADLENRTLQSYGPKQKWGRKKTPFLVNRLLAHLNTYRSGVRDPCWGLFLEPTCSAILDIWNLRCFLEISLFIVFFFLFLPIATVYKLLQCLFFFLKK